MTNANICGILAFVFPTRNPQASKGEQGKACIIGGSPNIHGAPILAGLGALASGVDLTRILLPKTHAIVARNAHTNFLVGGFFGDTFSVSDAEKYGKEVGKWADSVTLGCGFFAEETEAVCALLQYSLKAIVLDAGALQPEVLPLVSGRKNVLLTPHAGEFKILFGKRPPEALLERGLLVKSKASEFKVTIVSFEF